MKQRWILLRGLGRERGHWGTFPSQLSSTLQEKLGLEHVEVDCLDLPGTGSNQKGSRHKLLGPYSVDAIVDSLRSRVETSSLVLCGLSFGGMIALAWAARYPSDVAAVATINTSLGGLCPAHERMRPSGLWQLLRASATPDVEMRERRILELVSNVASARKGALPSWVRLAEEAPIEGRTVASQLVAAATFRLATQQLQSSGTWPPTLLLSGAGDRLVHPRCSQKIAEVYQWPSHVHPTGGHDLPLDAPEWLCAELGCFASKIS